MRIQLGNATCGECRDERLGHTRREWRIARGDRWQFEVTGDAVAIALSQFADQSIGTAGAEIGTLGGGQGGLGKHGRTRSQEGPAK